MVSAFTARPIIELKPRDKSKIESVLTFGDRLLVGLSTGSLRIYRINELTDGASNHHGSGDRDERPVSQPGAKAVELMRELEKFSKYKIEHLAIVKEANVLISLSNSQISFHDLQNYELRETLSKTKGAATFAVTSNAVEDASTEVMSMVSRLAVAIKRRLILWSWHDGELENETSEISLATGIKSMTWITGTRLIAGLTSSYVLVDVVTRAVTEIIGPGSIGGAPGQDGGRFGGAGVAGMSYLGMSAPQPLATQLGEGETLLARDINTLFIDTDGSSLGRRQVPWAFAPEDVGYSYPYLLALQAAKGILEIRNPKTLTLLQKIELPSAHQLHVPQPNVSLAHAGKGFLVLSERCIWRMQASDYNSQVDTLAKEGRLDEALSLLDMLEDALLQDKASNVRDIKMMKAQNLFDQQKYRDSIDLFTEVSAPPKVVIGLYPPFIAGGASVTSLGQKQNPSQHEDPTKQISEEHSQPTKSRESSASEVESSKDKSDNGKLLEGKELKNATEELRGFLVSARTKMKKVLDPDGQFKADATDQSKVEIASLLAKKKYDDSTDHEQLIESAKLVDTTLFRAYMFVSPSFAGPLFRIDNFCDPDVVNEKLIEAGRYNDLVDFFYGKGLHKQALDLLKRFGESDDSTEVAPHLAGPQRTVQYLQSLPPEMIDLILQFAEWPLKKDTDLGMEIFIADTQNAETLPRHKVLQYLQNIDRSLAVKYLEHVIYELDDTTPNFHQRLVNIYIEDLRANMFSNKVERTKWREKTHELLKSSTQYQAYKALGLLPKDDHNLYEARAIVLSKMGQHKQALDIYVFQLKDAEKAEQYCNEIYMSEMSSIPQGEAVDRTSKGDSQNVASSIYNTLLSLYLSPPPPDKPQWGPALNILAKHGARMPAWSTLNLIPETFPVKDLESYFRGRIRSANTIVNEGRIVAGMRSALAFSEESKLRLGDNAPGGNRGRNRRVVITEDRVCGVCYKRFGGSVIKVLAE
ncbi:Vacuolar morphogenesis protein 6 [Lecanora helva]